MKKLGNPFKGMKLHEYLLLSISIISIIVSFILIDQKDYLTLFTAIVGMFMAVFIARANFWGQIFSVFNVGLYAATAYLSRYYGELIIAICLYFPLTLGAIISWFRHPYKESNQIQIVKLGYKNVLIDLLITAIMTTVSFFIMQALDTPNLPVSTLSVAISTAAGYLIIKRSPYYALIYAINDLVLIVLWGMASIDAHQYLPLTISFVGFFASDTYGFVNWLRIRSKQKREIESSIEK